MPSRPGILLAITLILSWTPGSAVASSAAEEPAAREVFAAVVGLRTSVAPSARSAETLGSDRWGSGVVIDEDGLVLTIGYLLLEAETIEVRLHDGRLVPGQTVAYDHATGFGLLRVDAARGTRPLAFGDAAALQAGARALAVAHGGPEFMVPVRISDRREFAGYWEYLLEDALFTSPPHPVFGGAALLGPRGELLGIGSLAVNDAGRGGTLLAGNLFVPVDRLAPILDDLVAHGKVPGPARAWLGLYAEESADGPLVIDLADGGPAASAGVHPGDRISAVDGRMVASLADFYRRVWAQGPAGTVFTLDLLRGTETERVTVRSMDRQAWLRAVRPDG